MFKPSIAALAEYWPDDAKAIRSALDTLDDDAGAHISHDAARVLESVNTILDGFGVEGFSRDTQSGVQYVNFGDAYDVTILFVATGYGSGRFVIDSWGNFVERHPSYAG